MPTIADIFDSAVEHTGLYVFALAHGADVGSFIGNSITFPVNPEKVDAQTANKFTTYDVIRTGEHAFPRGRRLERVRWTGTLPGLGRFCDGVAPPWVNVWSYPPAALGPSAFLKRLIGLETMDEEGKCRLVITRPYVNMLCYVESVDWSSSGSYGDVEYTVTFVEARDIPSIAGEGVDPAIGFPLPGSLAALARVNNPLDPFTAPAGTVPGSSRNLPVSLLNPTPSGLVGINPLNGQVGDPLGDIGGLSPRPPIIPAPGPAPYILVNGSATWPEVAYRMRYGVDNANAIRQLNYDHAAEAVPVQQGGTIVGFQ